MWKMFSSIAIKLSARRKPTYNVVGQLRDDCRVGFKFLNCLAGGNQSFGDGFGHHSSMQNLSDNGGSARSLPERAERADQRRDRRAPRPLRLQCYLLNDPHVLKG